MDPQYQYELKKLKDFIVNVEEYFYYYYMTNRKNFMNVFNSVSSKLKIISVLDDSDRGIYGLTNAASDIILINPKLGRNAKLTPEERSRLYVAHE